ncbi:MAG: dipeptidase [Planctomycetaceae bacterium]|jgi:succinyl-diaminopimelate desuccinylase|nr:dipeptidase [Planctomycetaceae bacterium]
MTFEEYIASSRETFEQTLFDVLRIPSISALPEHKDDVRRCADWFRGYLAGLGLKTELIETAGNPLVYAESPAVKDAPVILVYGHYDVQPVDPLAQWKTPPFEPTVRNGSIYARGATDDKGQFITHVFAVESLLKTADTISNSQKVLPFQVKFIIEGEEESGGEGIYKYVASPEGQKKLACNTVLISDTSMFAPGQPTITYGLRGIVAMELFLTGPNRDLHSGTFGGSVYNPAIALTKILSQLIDNNGRVSVPNFYDDVVPLTERESKQFANLPFDDDDYFRSIGLKTGFGEAGFSTVERRCARPTFDINGITAGYQGSGSKTIIPASASAKFTCRMVPNQDPQKIAASIREYIATLIPEGIDWKLEFQHGAPGMRLDLDKSKFVQPMCDALEKTFGCPPVFTREGGSIPIAADFNRQLKAEVLLVGWGQDDDALHSPNEKFSLAGFHSGILASARFLNSIKRL